MSQTKEFMVALHRAYLAANQAVVDYSELVAQLPPENRPPLIFLAVPPLNTREHPDVSISVMGNGVPLHGMLVQVAQHMPQMGTLVQAVAETLHTDGV